MWYKLLQWETKSIFYVSDILAIAYIILFNNNIYMLKVDITVCFKINFHSIYISSFLSYIFRSQSLSLSHSLTYSFSLLLIHSLTLIYPLWHPLFRTYTVHLSFIPKYLQVKKKEKKKQLTTDSNALWITGLEIYWTYFPHLINL